MTFSKLFSSGRGLVLSIALTGILLYAGSPRMALAQSPEAVKIRVEITDNGFQCVTKPPNCRGEQEGLFIIEMEQGQLVELTLVWAHKSKPLEEHILALEGYKLESDALTPSNREATLKFVADKPGTFEFKCDLKCDLHERLQKGQLIVKRGGVASVATALTPTILALAPSTTILAGGESVNLKVTLKDGKGAPVSKAEIRFYSNAEFIGRKGKMEIGVAKTDANGAASLDYATTLEAERQKITAQFEGMGIYAESQQTIEIQLAGVPPAAYVVGPIGTESIGQIVAITFIAVLLGIWSIYSFVVLQVVKIWRGN
ncbi:MAG: hypothetical protein HY327_11480 [Chloroflexi bacterium]|nr:hypothetical protein [Chloroflexota bacterium]